MQAAKGGREGQRKKILAERKKILEEYKEEKERIKVNPCEKKEEVINTSRNIIGKVMKRRKKIPVCNDKRENYGRGV